MTTTAGAPASTGSFAARIREATTDVHRQAERAPFLGALLGGKLPIEDYGRMVVQHRAIYEALEAGNDALRDDEVVGGFVDDAVVRLPALQRDVDSVLGPAWASTPQAELVPATIEYCTRLREVAATWPAGWVGHQYVRYLGDLSGGLFIRRRIEQVYGIDAASGTAFYDFPKVPDPDAWKQAYRARLDALPWSVAECDAVIEEILAGYRWNTDLLEQLGER